MRTETQGPHPADPVGHQHEQQLSEAGDCERARRSSGRSGGCYFDADTGIDRAREIREYFIRDFSNWKEHDSYSRAFDPLVRGLKTGGSGAAAVEG
jgi:hypothetical protein